MWAFSFLREKNSEVILLTCPPLADSQEHIGVSCFSIAQRTSDGRKKTWRALHTGLALTPVYSWLLSYLDEFVLIRAYIQKCFPNYKCMVKYAFLESGNRAIKNNPGPQKPSAARLGLGAPSPQMEAVFCLRGSALPAGRTGARPLPCRRPCSGSPLVSISVD